MPPFILPVWAFVKGVPWQAYAAAALILAIGLSYYTGRKHENARWLQRLEIAEQRAIDDGLKAIVKADEIGAKEAQEFEAQQEVLRDIIKEAQANDENSLDALF